MYYKNAAPIRRQKKRGYSFSHFGFPTILLTFVMLCIMTFGILSLVTANSDLKLTNKVAEKATGYYKAEEVSYQKLTQLEQILKEIYSTAPTEDNFKTMIVDQLTETDIGTIVYSTENDYVYLNWTIDISGAQYLSVMIKILSLDEVSATGKYYSIEEWYTAHTESTEEVDDSLHVIGND